MGAISSHLEGLNKTHIVWKWEHRHNEFRPYCPSISKLIEKHYRSGSNSQIQIKAINLINYEIDLKELVQVNTLTKKKRRIIREIQKDTSYTIRWSWENDFHEMQFYSPEVSEKLEAHFIRGIEHPIKVNLFGRQYLIDPIKKIQISVSSNKKRRIERNTIPGHKSIWQWQQDDGDFIDYVQEDMNRIEQHFISKTKENPLYILINGANYEIDTENLVQVSKSETSKYSQIRRVEENYVRYGWSWKDEEGRWTQFSPYFVEKLEKNYLSPSQSPLSVQINGSQFEIDTRGMVQRSVEAGDCYQIKREPLSNDRTVWFWVSKNDELKTVPANISQMLETQYMLNETTPMVFDLKGKTYKLDVTRMEKVNIKTNSVRKLERRVIPNNYPSELDLLPKSQCAQVLKYLCNTGYLPVDWDWENQSVRSDLIPVTDIERNVLTGKFQQLDEYDVQNIFRVQSQSLVNYFLLERMNIRNFLHGADEPTLLFYLADREQKPEEIYNALECGLTDKYSPNKEYGRGFYFTKSPKLANRYAFSSGETGTKVLICFWVLLGRIASINSEEDQKAFYKGKYDRLANIEKEPPGCDSISGMIDDEEVYVLYRPERCYPLYLLEYSEAH